MASIDPQPQKYNTNTYHHAVNTGGNWSPNQYPSQPNINYPVPAPPPVYGGGTWQITTPDFSVELEKIIGLLDSILDKMVALQERIEILEDDIGALSAE